MAKKTRKRITRKLINEYKASNRKDEPAALGSKFVYTNLSLGLALNWYSENGDISKLRKYVDEYALNKCKIDLSECKDKQYTMTICALAKMVSSGCKLPKRIDVFLTDHINDLAKTIVPKSSETINDVPEINKTISDTEDMLDVFYNSNYKNNPVDYYAYLLEKQPKPTEVRSAVFYYEPLLEEIKTAKDLSLTSIQRKRYIAFLEKILEDIIQYLSNSRKERKLRKPRKKKLKSADQLVSKVQFKPSDNLLKITSIPPTNIVGATSVWFFNTKYKKMTYLEADDGKTLSIKGTTIIGFNPKKSICKAIRKAEKILPELLNSPKMAMKNKFIALKTKPTAAKGRLNKDVLILKANK